MRTHGWRDRTEAGELRLLRAVHHGGRWRLSERLPADERFRVLDPIPLEDLRALREVIAEKYRRGRVPYEHLQQLAAMIEAAEAGTD